MPVDCYDFKNGAPTKCAHCGQRIADNRVECWRAVRTASPFAMNSVPMTPKKPLSNADQEHDEFLLAARSEHLTQWQSMAFSEVGVW